MTPSLNNQDHLFLIDKTIKFAAAPELGYPDCFNSGMMVLTPSTDLYERLLQLAGTMPSFDGGDQGLLNIFFGDGNCQGLREAQTTINEGQEKGNDDLPGVVCLGDCYSCTKSWYRLSYGYNVQLNRVSVHNGVMTSLELLIETPAIECTYRQLGAMNLAIRFYTSLAR